jgi:hypothetical protein
MPFIQLSPVFPFSLEQTTTPVYMYFTGQSAERRYVHVAGCHVSLVPRSEGSNLMWLHIHRDGSRVQARVRVGVVSLIGFVASVMITCSDGGN